LTRGTGVGIVCGTPITAAREMRAEGDENEMFVTAYERDAHNPCFVANYVATAYHDGPSESGSVQLRLTMSNGQNLSQSFAPGARIFAFEGDHFLLAEIVAGDALGPDACDVLKLDERPMPGCGEREESDDVDEAESRLKAATRPQAVGETARHEPAHNDLEYSGFWYKDGNSVIVFPIDGREPEIGRVRGVSRNRFTGRYMYRVQPDARPDVGVMVPSTHLALAHCEHSYIQFHPGQRVRWWADGYRHGTVTHAVVIPNDSNVYVRPDDGSCGTQAISLTQIQRVPPMDGTAVRFVKDDTNWRVDGVFEQDGETWCKVGRRPRQVGDSHLYRTMQDGRVQSAIALRHLVPLSHNSDRTVGGTPDFQASDYAYCQRAIGPHGRGSVVRVLGFVADEGGYRYRVADTQGGGQILASRGDIGRHPPGPML